MTKREKLKRDIDGLRESITLGWQEVGREPMPRPERDAYIASIRMLVDQLHELLRELEVLDAQGS